MEIDNGGPAFPRQLKQPHQNHRFEESEKCSQSGMTLRQYYAGQQYAARLQADIISHFIGEVNSTPGPCGTDQDRIEASFKDADALIAASRKGYCYD